MSQIRLTKTEDIDAVLSYLRGRYPLLSETEIIKMALSEKYHETMRETMDDDVRRHEAQNLEEILLAGIRSDRGMEVGSKEWKTFREHLRAQVNENSKNKEA